ncbi:MAG: hypothetical protein ABI053_06175 [Lacisediminihabitans sp.]
MDWAWASGIGVAVLGLFAVISWLAVELLAEVDEERIDLAEG